MKPAKKYTVIALTRPNEDDGDQEAEQIVCREASPQGLEYCRERLIKFNSLTAIDGHDCQYFNELRSTVVSRQIFIRLLSLIAC